LTLWHENNGAGLGTGFGLSLLLHALLIMLAFFWLKTPGQSLPPSYYRIRLVDMPPPALKSPMPERPSEVEVQRPSAPEPASEAQPAVSETARPAMPDLGPTAFFDREAIESAATSSARQEAARDDGVTFDTRDMMYRGYLDMLRQKVESIWHYPKRAAEQGIYGDLVIRFVILKDGTLGEVKVLRTSGHRLLDNAAVEALRDGVPYWPLPEGWDRQSLPITGRFIYSINGGYIR
jgi:protein TonB